VGLPDGIAGLYFGGGYPELYAEALSRNDALRAAVHAAHQADMPIYAECGGLMFLTQSFIDLEGRHYP
jgi:cobyrinic acid a,c-diamide synthase